MAKSSDPAALFIGSVSQQTGLSPRVVAAWVRAEGAYAANGTGHFNFLNVRPAAGGVSYSGVPISVSPGNFEQFASVQDAIAETVNRIRQPFAHGILQSAKSGDAAQLHAIASSNWDSSHYAGGRKLVDNYRALGGGGGFLSTLEHLGVAGLAGPAAVVAGPVGVAAAGLGALGGGVSGILHPGRTIDSAIGAIVSPLLKGALAIVFVVGALVLIYMGVRRAAGDRLPSGRDLGQAVAAGMKENPSMAAAAAA